MIGTALFEKNTVRGIRVLTKLTVDSEMQHEDKAV